MIKPKLSYLSTIRVPLRRSLGAQLLAAFVLIAFISVAGLGLPAYLNEQTALEAQVIEKLTSVADLKKEQIVSWFAERHADVRLLAVNRLNQDHFTQVLSLDIAAEHRVEMAAFLTDNLIGLQRSRVGYGEIAFVNRDGLVVIATDPTLVGQPTSHQVIFAGTLAAPSGKYIQDVHLNPETGLTSMGFGHVIRAVDLTTGQELPQIVGIAYIIVNMEDTIYPLIEAWPGMGSTGETLLVRMEGTDTLFLNNLRFDPDAALKLRIPIGSPFGKSAYKTSYGEEGVIQTLDYRSVPVLAAYRYIPEVNWGFVAKEDLDEIFAPINVLAWRIGLVAVAVLFVAGLTSVFLSRKLTRPLAQLVEGTHAVAAGDLAVEIDIDRQDEVGVLANAFNRMTTQLKLTLEGLQQHLTELKSAESALRESEERFRSLLEAASEGIILTNGEKQVVLVNAQIERSFGYSRDELLGQPIEILLPERFRETHLGLRTDFISNLNVRPMDLGLNLSGRRKDGSEFPIEIGLSHIETKDGPLVMSFIIDITERKQLEDQLRQSQKMEAIGQLAGGVAHDFNNILTVIIGYSELLLHRLNFTEPREEIEEIKRAGERAAALTRQLLSFSRRQVLQPKVLNLNTIVIDIEKMLRRLISENINLTTSLELDLDRIKADPGQIEQVILNLVVNARDAMPQGGFLTVETTNVTLGEGDKQHKADIKEPGPYVMLTVSDTGIGMDNETLSQIFEPFFTTKGKDRGTGLGLATVYGIVTRNNGHISVESQPGQGTTFRIYLPRCVEEIDVLDKASTLPELPPGSETILLVEDDSEIRTLVCKILEESGYTMLDANQGDTAVQICATYPGPIDLVLTDIVMPGQIGGHVLATKLKAIRPDIKVLYMSGYADGAIAQAGRSELDPAFIQKPFSPNVLACQVRNILDYQPVKPRHSPSIDLAERC